MIKMIESAKHSYIYESYDETHIVKNKKTNRKVYESYGENNTFFEIIERFFDYETVYINPECFESLFEQFEEFYNFTKIMKNTYIINSKYWK